MTVDVPSVSSTTVELSGPTSVTRPASAPPPTTTTSPSLIPAFEPLSSPITRRNSEDSREMTPAATVLWSKPAWSWSIPVRISFSRRTSSDDARCSADSRSFSSRSAALSTRSRSISAIAFPIDAMPPAT